MDDRSESPRSNCRRAASWLSSHPVRRRDLSHLSSPNRVAGLCLTAPRCVVGRFVPFWPCLHTLASWPPVKIGSPRLQVSGTRREDLARGSPSRTRFPYLARAPTTALTTTGRLIRESWVRIPPGPPRFQIRIDESQMDLRVEDFYGTLEELYRGVEFHDFVRIVYAQVTAALSRHHGGPASFPPPHLPSAPPHCGPASLPPLRLQASGPADVRSSSVSS